VAWIRRVRTASGATAVQIAESVQGRRRIIAHVGSAHTDAELGLLMQRARELLDDPAQGELDLGVEPMAGQASLLGPADDAALFGQEVHPARGRPVVAAPRVVATASRVLYDVLAGVFTSLGFDALGDEVFRDLVIARLVEPTSILDTPRVLADLGRTPASEKTMRRTLARAHEGTYRDTVAELCFAHATSRGDVSLVLYDVTTLYFEAEREDELRRVGYSKERRVDPQIVVGLLVDRGGFPLEIGCFEGNKAETATIVPIAKQFQDRHDLADMVIVADAGMLSAANLRELDEANLRFIVGSRMTKAPIDLASHFHWHGDVFTDGQVIDTITPRTGRTSENNQARRAEPVWYPDQHARSWRAVWAYSAKRAARDNRTLTAQENRARADPAVRQDHRRRAQPGSGGPRPRPPTGRAEGLRHQHPGPGHARKRGDRLVPRPLAGRAVLPDEQDRPGRPAHVRAHPRRDRGTPDHRVHRARRRPHRARPHRPGGPQRDPSAPAPAVSDHRDQRHHRNAAATDRPRPSGHHRRPRRLGLQALTK
jgi:hypothetical protein